MGITFQVLAGLLVCYMPFDISCHVNLAAILEYIAAECPCLPPGYC